MSILLEFLGKVPAWVWLVATLAFALWWQTDSLEEAQLTITAQSSRLKAYAESQKTNLGAIKELEAANKLLAEGSEADVQGNKDAVASLKLENEKLTGQLAAARHLREVQYRADPTCKIFARTPVCPGLAERLRALPADRADGDR